MPWDTYLISIAMAVAAKSKDPSTKVGAVIVGEHHNILSTGFNGFPRGVRETVKHTDGEVSEYTLDAERWERPAKYLRVEHAERNAIFNAARHGVRLEGASMYMNWEPCPCTDCARAIIQSGIVEVVGPNWPFAAVGKGKYYDVDDVAKDMLKEAEVIVRSVPWGK